MSQKFTIPGIVIVIGIAAFLAGRGSVSPAPGKSTETGNPQTRSSSSDDDSLPPNRGKSERHTVTSTERPATAEARRAKLEGILHIADPMDRHRALLSLLDQLSPDELKETAENFASFKLPGDRADELKMMLTAWAKVDPIAALTYVEVTSINDYAIQSMVDTWLANDPEAAIAWAKTHYARDAESTYIACIIGGLAATDLPRATVLLNELSDGKALDNAYNSIFPHIRAQGAEATREWISGLTNATLRNAAIDDVAIAFVMADAKATATWLAANPCEASTRYLTAVLSHLGRNDPAAAIAIYEGLPAGVPRSKALSGVVSAMINDNPQAGASFLDSHPADVTDEVLYVLGSDTIARAPDLALSYISKIQDPKARADGYEMAISNWLKTDPAAAKAYFQTHPRPENLPDYIEEGLDMGK